MNLHEYQSKQLFSDYAIPVPEHRVVTSIAETVAVLSELGGERWVIKAQVHAGGRGKAGGVKIVDSKQAAEDAVNQLLGSQLVTVQTDEKGQPVHKVLIEAPCEISRELYVGAVIDRAQNRVVIMASTEGGVEIEKVAKQSPDKILQVAIEPVAGLQAYQCRQLAFGLKLEGAQIKQFSHLLMALSKLIHEKDLNLVEINPLVVTAQGNLLCLDAKITLDDNALYRHSDLQALRDISQEDKREVRARESDLNYISLDGDIGCMVNGAGLAMATMDLIKLHGGNPANFLDVGGAATRERVTEALKIILSDENVKAVLVNIFGGIVRCDMIAEGIVGAVKDAHINVPLVVRLEGNNAQRGTEILNDCGLEIIAATDLNAAAKKVVAATL